jgi:hypothetical protein
MTEEEYIGYEIPENGGFYHWVKVQIKRGTVQTQVMKIPFPFAWETFYRIFFLFQLRRSG